MLFSRIQRQQEQESAKDVGRSRLQSDTTLTTMCRRSKTKQLAQNDTNKLAYYQAPRCPSCLPPHPRSPHPRCPHPRLCMFKTLIKVDMPYSGVRAQSKAYAWFMKEDSTPAQRGNSACTSICAITHYRICKGFHSIHGHLCKYSNKPCSQSAHSLLVHLFADRHI